MKKTVIREIGEGFTSIVLDVNPFSMLVTYGGVTLSWLFGSWDLSLQILLTLVTIDYITGVLRAIKQKKLNSDIGFRGLLRKGGILFVVVLSVLLDRLLENDTWVIRTYVSYFFIANEGMSILENTTSLGVPFPEKLVSVLEQLKDGNKKGKD